MNQGRFVLDGTTADVEAVVANETLGRMVKIYRGRRGDAAASYELWLDGVVRGVTSNGARIEVAIGGGGGGLDAPIGRRRFSGTGATGGPPGLRGTPRPWIAGRVTGVEPTLVDPARLLWEVHQAPPAGASAGVLAVRDRGVALARGCVAPYADALALLAADVAPGEWCDSADGFVRLGGAARGRRHGRRMGRPNAGCGARTRW